jgi:hypothetical protein
MGTRRVMVDKTELARLRASFEKARDDLAYAEGMADAFAYIDEAKKLAAEKIKRIRQLTKERR